MITAADVIAKVRELAAENPDYVYPGAANTLSYLPTCANIERNDAGEWAGSCLIGKAVIGLGISPLTILEKDAAGMGAENLMDSLGVRWTQDQIEWLGGVQCLQDDGYAWGLAVRETDHWQ